MAEEDLFFPQDGSEAWLDVRDVRLAVHLLRQSPPPEGHEADRRVLEIGVWKGAWATSILMNVPDSIVDGVDPYPLAFAEARDTALSRIQGLNLKERFSLWSDVVELPQERTYDLIHIDGEHSEEAAWRDLSFSFSVLRPHGVIIVDDINNYWYPGIASAMWRFCGETDLRMFMTSGLKGYLARSATAAILADRLYNEVRAMDSLTAYHGYDDFMGHSYRESPEVLGQTVINVRDATGPGR